MSVAMAWEVFGDKVGDPDFGRFAGRIARYRSYLHDEPSAAPVEDQPLSCLVLREAVFLPSSQWLPWGREEDWSPRILSFKTYDLASGPGRTLQALIEQSHPEPVPDLAPVFQPLAEDSRVVAERRAAVREAQGTFRLQLLAAYAGRCAVTGEHALPVLEAVHIQPYRGPASNHVQNGLVLRADLHRLYDGGYLTVTPDLRLEVSGRLDAEYRNGRAYYAMAGRRVAVPQDPALQPSRAALSWHARHVFR
jgi:putative restriction endonuclease